MNATGTRFAIGAAALLLVGALGAGDALASIGRVEFTIGDVDAVDAGGVRRKLVKGSALDAGDTVVTGKGRAQIRFSDGGYTSLQPGTEFRIDEYDYDERDEESSRSFFSLLKGGLRTITGAIGKISRKAYRISTPVATIGIRGTEYLASLGNSLTVHVGEGEIEVCSSQSCSTFGSHETGYVPDADSPPIEVDEPPSLAPPQERQNYAYNGGYQDSPDAGASYSRNDDVNSDGTSDVIDAQALENGPHYVIAVSSVGVDLVSQLFTKGAPGSLVDATFDSSQTGLVEYSAPGSATPTGAIMSARLEDVGTADGVIGWGRWTGGTVLTGTSGAGSEQLGYFGTQSHHYVVGLPAADLPSGTASYSLAGATSPTLLDGSGTPGTVNSASLTADFGTASVSLDMNLTMSGTGYDVNVANMNIGGGAKFSSTTASLNQVTNSGECISAGCSAAVEGFFSGNGASHAGIGYRIDTPSKGISGAAAFKKD